MNDNVIYGRSRFERLYALQTTHTPQGEIYLTCKPSKWPRRRKLTIRRHPELFDRVPFLPIKKRPI